MAWLVAGLGNPGDRYATSRHNLGRMVAEELAREERERFRKARFLPAEIAEIHHGGERVLLVRSTHFMNESGPSFAGVAKKQDIEPANVIAVHDELDIPAGTLRVKLGGGTSGHNGLKSLQRALRTPEFLRVRVGIGRPPGRQDPADFVLELDRQEGPGGPHRMGRRRGRRRPRRWWPTASPPRRTASTARARLADSSPAPRRVRRH